MAKLEERFVRDIERIQSLQIVPSILELICRTTGMGFSAVARVTEHRWIACAVKDEINFGLVPGGELEIGTTICNEIREHNNPVVIDDVQSDLVFCNHHTPKTYGFRSYISIPILLKDGSFFGTLCAIDPKPASLKNTNMVTMFVLYADLISYHLQTQDELLLKQGLLSVAEARLKESQNDVRQFMHINRHTLSEPLRKLQFFSDQIGQYSIQLDHQAIRETASKINRLAGQFYKMINRLTDLSEVNEHGIELVDLNIMVQQAVRRLQEKVSRKNARLELTELPFVTGNPAQLTELFLYLIDNALNFSKNGEVPVIKVQACPLDEEILSEVGYLEGDLSHYSAICVEDNGIGIDNAHLEKIFDLFGKLKASEQLEGLGMGLSHSRRIIRYHRGAILVRSTLGKGSTFILILPTTSKREPAVAYS